MENNTTIENSTLLTINSSMANSSTENSTISNNTRPEMSFDVIIALFTLLMFLLSTISVTIHVFKFFNSKQKQNVQIRNLTNYCACLLMVYLFTFIYFFTHVSDDFPLTFRFIDSYLHISESILLLIMSIHTCMCIVVSQKAYHIPFSDDTQFLIYSIIGWLFSLLLASLIFLLESYHPKIIIILLIRLLAVIPFFISLWYLRSIGWNRRNIIKNFVIHLRLLILTGALSIIPNTIYGILLLLNEESSLTRIFGQVADVFYYPEGFIVGLCFTFRKGTFENHNQNPIEMTNGYVTDMAEVVVDGEDES